MGLINKFLNSFLFWAAWIIIPVVMEIVPSIGSVVVLLKKRICSKKSAKPAIDPEISLIIPIYNSMDTLEQCIQSIDQSDYPDSRIRIFLVNNQGQDDSFQVFCECQQKYPELRMQWLNAKQGKSKALNLALFNSEGKYIIHIDSDGLLEKSALRNMVYKFENDQSIECMTGVILTDPAQVQKYPLVFPRLLRKLEFMEYAQAFLAGRNYASEMNAIYTLSGAFSAFRKSSVLKSQLYNTDTICEDTQITFQMKYLLNTKVGICEDAIFFVDPIEDMNKLYTQRQRWQRGSLEVSHLFLKDKLKAKNMFTNVGVRTLVYDHTFAFPRMIWYLALFCLLCMNYSFKLIGFSTLFLFFLYILIGYFYYISTIGFLKDFKEIRKYYAKQWYVIPLLPVFNLIVFFIRFAGVINSINTDSAWKVKNFTEEKNSFKKTIADDFCIVLRAIRKLRKLVNVE
ncbi:MAG: putative glycosyltransferase, exosortase G system-associated [Lachnospiraceae bacterium]|nr:putative glycosyltransferase, exosortase G system-associated [Lachnospiraceae bacterium]